MAMIITLRDYFMGRDEAYAAALTLEISRNAVSWVAAANELLSRAAEDGVEPGVDELTGNCIASGWRPPAVNARTSNAGKLSTHLSGRGGDVEDHPDRRLARWCLKNLDQLETLGIWMEDPRWTPTWVHWQIVPPGSGKRVYIPSNAPALALALPEQQTT